MWSGTIFLIIAAIIVCAKIVDGGMRVHETAKEAVEPYRVASGGKVSIATIGLRMAQQSRDELEVEALRQEADFWQGAVKKVEADLMGGVEVVDEVPDSFELGLLEQEALEFIEGEEERGHYRLGNKQAALLGEALWRYSRQDAYESPLGGAMLTERWTGFGCATDYSHVSPRYMAPVDERPGYQVWWKLTEEGAAIVQYWLSIGYTYEDIEAENFPPTRFHLEEVAV